MVADHCNAEHGGVLDAPVSGEFSLQKVERAHWHACKMM
jgi:hypothetical protein